MKIQLNGTNNQKRQKGEIKMNEWITTAAIKYRIKGEHEFKYVTGPNHSYCLDMLSCMDLYSTKRDMDVEEQGFCTNVRRFVNRKDAFEIARMAGQIPKSYNKTELISDDVKFR